MSAPLDPSVVAALDDFGALPAAWRTLSAIRTAQHRRTTIRVDLADGRRVKARVVEDEATARSLAGIRAQAPPAFAAVLHVHGSVLIEAWIEGVALPVRVTGAHAADAAALLAALHSTPMLSGRTLHTVEPTASERARAEEALARLTANGHLRAREPAAIASALMHGDPGDATTGFVHTDFCGENMVVDERGRLNVIDNERMGVGALGLDVARTWYRWRLAPGAWERFRRAYASSSAHADALADFSFWALVATLKSAALRLELDPARVGVPLAALRRALTQARHPT